MQRVFGDLDALLHVDGRLDDERKAAFLAHLADDPSEAERVATWSRQNEVIRAMFAPVALEPVPLWLRLGHVAAERSASRELLDRRSRGETQLIEPRTGPRRFDPAPVAEPPPPPRQRHRSTSIGLSAAVLLGIGALVLVAAHTLLPQPIEEATARIEEEAAGTPTDRAVAAYRTYALDPLHPVEMTVAQQPALDGWLQRRVGLAVRAPDLRAEGWTALGGRLVPGVRGPAAYYVYENSLGERLGLYAARTATGPTAAMALDPIADGGSTLSWSSGRATFVVTVGKSLDWLSRNAETLRTRVTKANGDD